MTPFQSDFSAASSINKKGEKVGGYVNSDGFFRAVLRGKQGVRELGTLGGDESEAYWIGDKGEAVGWCELLGSGFGWIAGTTDSGSACLPIPYKSGKEMKALRDSFKR